MTSPTSVWSWSGFYVKTYGGGLLANTLKDNLGVSLPTLAGSFFGGAIGIDTGVDNLSVELDGSVGSNRFAVDPTLYFTTVSLMLNGVVTVPVVDKVSLYAGAGLGVIGLDFGGSTGDVKGTGAGGQLFAGALYAVTPKISVFGEARLQAALPSVHVTGIATGDLFFTREALLAGVKFGLRRGHLRRFSIASQIIGAMLGPPKRLISRMPVGEVTLISVR